MSVCACVMCECVSGRMYSTYCKGSGPTWPAGGAVCRWTSPSSRCWWRHWRCGPGRRGGMSPGYRTECWRTAEPRRLKARHSDVTARNAAYQGCGAGKTLAALAPIKYTDSEWKFPAAPAPTPAMGKMCRLRRLRFRLWYLSHASKNWFVTTCKY